MGSTTDMARPVALITGAASGIGLALTKHLTERNWYVVMLDINPPPQELPDTIFVRTDVTSWEQQAAAFAEGYAWKKRLDFAALNAGIDDRDDIFLSLSRDAPPKKPNMKTFDVNLIGPYYGLKLAAHYMNLDSSAAGKPKSGGKVVITASVAGLYPSMFAPQYGATKHGIVGLARSVAPLAEKVNIRVNILCPALVATNLAPDGLLENFTEKDFTPMSTMLRAFTELADLENVASEDWVTKGRNGDAVEGNLDRLIWHDPPQPEEVAFDENGFKAWERIYTKRNREFGLQQRTD